MFIPMFAALVLLAAAPLQAQVPAVAAPGPHEAVLGTWQGSLALPGGVSLALVFHIALDENGSLTGTLDSPDQGARGIPFPEATFSADTLRLALPAASARFEGVLPEADRLSGTWTQGGTSFPLEMERVDEVAVRARPQEPERPLPYREEEVRYPNIEAGIQLAGTLTLPEGAEPFPAVALISGSGAQNRDSELFGHRFFYVLSDHLTRRGIAVLRSDDRGVGESGGVFREATSEDFAGDAAAAATYLRSRPEIDADAVGLVGLSEGGMIAPMVAADADGIAFIVLMAGPGLPGEEILYLQGELVSRAMGAPEDAIERTRRLQSRLFQIVVEEEDERARDERIEAELRTALGGMSDEERESMGVPPEAEDAWIEAQIGVVSGPWFRFFLVHDPRPVLRRVGVPVLALNGELDLQVPPTENLEAIEQALREGGNPDVTVQVLPGLNHLFQTAETGAPVEYGQIEETMAPVAMDVVARWILERARGSAPGGMRSMGSLLRPR